MLIQRLVTAAVGIPLAVFLVHRGGWLFALSIAALMLFAWLEYRLLLRRVGIRIFTRSGIVAAGLLLGTMWLGNAYETLFVLAVLPVGLWLAVLRQKPPFTLQEMAFTLMGVLYIGFGFGHFLALREVAGVAFVPTWGVETFGEALLWLALAGTWASDTGAFAVGSLVGKHKMAPQISPGKTWEGFVGGWLLCVAVVCALGSGFQLPTAAALGMGFLIGVAAPAGDLAESVLKRFGGVKDSGKIFPGHGGVLDRFDSLLFVVPLVYYYVLAFLL